VRHDFFVEFVAQDDGVFKANRKHFLGWVTVVPELSLAEKIEPGALNDARLCSRGFRAEEDGRPEDPLKGCN
jgi:hypothetical protein